MDCGGGVFDTLSVANTLPGGFEGLTKAMEKFLIFSGIYHKDFKVGRNSLFRQIATTGCGR